MRIVGGTEAGDNEDDRPVWEREDGVESILRKCIGEEFDEVVVVGSRYGGGYHVWSSWETAEASIGALEMAKAQMVRCNEHVIQFEPDDASE